MIRTVLDEVVPADFIKLFADEDIEVIAFPDAWRSLSDGEIISRGKPLSVMVLPTPKIALLEPIRSALETALRQPAPGHFIRVDGNGTPIGEPVPHAIGRTGKSN